MYAPTPDGEVKILRGVPNDPDYKHTLYWASAGAQSVYFASKAKASYDHLMYVRETGQLRVPCKSDDLDDCNYLMYRNEQYVDKWFYAFIKQVYYRNDNCCFIEFEIDVIQTYFFDIELKQSFIERQHTETDNIGDNRVPESLAIGNYVTRYTEKAFTDNLWSIIAYATFDWSTWQLTSGDIQAGVYTGLTRTWLGEIHLERVGSSVNAYWTTDARIKINDLVINHANLVDGLVALVMVPSTLETGSKWKHVLKPTTSWDLDGYTPNNHKLYTAPYTILYVTDSNGSGKEFEFESFIGDARFDMFTDRAANPTVVLAPKGYRMPPSGAQSDALNFEEAVFCTGFAQCAWVSSAFQTYLALSSNSLSQSLANATFDTIIGGIGTVYPEMQLATGSGFGTFTSGLKSIALQLSDFEDKKKLPPRVHGNTTGSGYMGAGEKSPRMITLTLRAENAKIIDDYFTVYGYAIRQVAVPNIAARPHWTYIKTVDANILPKANGGLPSPALQKIIQVFDRGTTFWKTPSEVGDYSLNNAPA